MVVMAAGMDKAATVMAGGMAMVAAIAATAVVTVTVKARCMRMYGQKAPVLSAGAFLWLLSVMHTVMLKQRLHLGVGKTLIARSRNACLRRQLSL